MNILFLGYFPFIASDGGIQRVTDTLTKEFIKKGHNVYFLCVDDPEELYPGYITSAPQYFINRNCGNWKEKIHQLLQKHNINYIVHQGPTSITTQIISDLDLKIKIISVFHTQPFLNDEVTRKQIYMSRTYNFKQFCFKYLSYIFPFLRRIVFGYYERKNIIAATEISDKICFISERFFPRVLKHIPNIPKDKMVAINNPNSFDVCHSSLQKENIVLWVGRIDNANKNTIDFVKVWNLIYKNNPSWKAIVAGVGFDFDVIKKYVQNNHIKNIELIGDCKNIQELYKKSKFVVVTSYSESWCMVITEGLSQGCIPIAYDTFETLHDIIKNDYNGFITKPNPKSMSFKLNEIMNNEILYQNIYQNTFESVNKYSVENISNSWINLLSSI